MQNDNLVGVAKPFVHLADFDGPLDLLLHLINTAEIDIYDIPIEKITRQYVAILKENQDHQLEIAGEYFVMASTLMRIKSRLLLPSIAAAVEEEDEPVEDPREELVDQLLEYQRYQRAAKHLEEKAIERQREYTREAMAVPTELVAKVQPGVTIDQLQAAFEDLLKRRQVPELPEVETAPEKITVAERIDFIRAKLTSPVRFVDLFSDQLTRDNLVTTFMALLELCRHQVVQVIQAEAFGPLIVEKGSNFDEQPSQD